MSNKATGVIAGKPKILVSKAGSRYGTIEVKIEGVGKGNASFFDDPEDLKLFSFVPGDEVDVTWKKNGQYLNVTINTPRGSGNAEEALARALSIEAGGSSTGEGDAVDELLHMAVIVREAVNEVYPPLIGDEVSADQVEETLRSVSTGILMGLDRRGVTLADLL